MVSEADRGRYQAMFEHVQDGVLFADDQGRCIDANPAACALTGYTREELLQLTVWDLTPPASRESLHSQWSEFLARGRLRGEYPVLRKDGATAVWDVAAVANVLPGVHVSVSRDVTAHQRAEEALGQTEFERGQLEGVLIAARTISHAVNSDLAIPLGIIGILVARQDLDPAVRTQVERVADSLMQTAQHVNRLHRVVRVETRDTPLGPALDLDRSIQPKPD